MCIFCSSCQIVGPTGIFGSHPHVVGQVVVAYDDLREIALLVPCCIGLDHRKYSKWFGAIQMTNR